MMKMINGLIVAGVAALALSGCAGVSDDDLSCNTKLIYEGCDDGASGGDSLITLNNNSGYAIESVYSGEYGNNEVESANIPTDSGESFTVNSSNCDNNQILRIIDDENCAQSVSFYRGCNQTAVFRVDNK